MNNDSMSCKRHRIIVQLNDKKTDDAPKNIPFNRLSGSKVPESHLMKTSSQTEIEVIDRRILAIRNKHAPSSCPFIFDNVANATDLRMRGEIASFMDKLLLEHQNCCMIRFGVERKCLINFLSDLLVSEFDKRFKVTHAIVHTIKLEYYDISKLNIVNMIGKASKQRQRLKNHFTSTLELWKWLQNVYGRLWNLGQDHECFDLQLIYADGERRIHKVKLSFLFFYMEKMDDETKVGLHLYLANINNPKLIEHSMITACLVEYFREKDCWWTWMFFELPHSHSSSFTDELIQLGVAAYNGVKILNTFEVEQTNIHSTETKLKTQSAPCKRSSSYSFGSTYSRQETKSASKLAPQRRISFSNDFPGLSAWYCKIDEKFINVVKAMEVYYTEKYNSEILKMCADIRKLVTNNEIFLDEVQGLLCDNATVYDDALQVCYNEFKAALYEFQGLMAEVENTNFFELLRVYLKTKSYELSQHALNVKVKHLERCHMHLSGTIKDELDNLRDLKEMSACPEPTEQEQ